MSARPRRDRRTRLAAPVTAVLLVGLACGRLHAPRPGPAPARAAPTSAADVARPARPGRSRCASRCTATRRSSRPTAARRGLHRRAPRRHRQGRGRRPTPSRPRTSVDRGVRRGHPARPVPRPGRLDLPALVADGRRAARRRAARAARRAVRRQLPAASGSRRSPRDSALQCMPNDVSPYVVFYNKRLLVPAQRSRCRARRRRAPERGWPWNQFVAAAQAMSQGRRQGRLPPARAHHAACRWCARPAPTSSTTTAQPDHADASPTTSTRPALEEILAVARDPTITPTAAPAGQAGRGDPLRERPAGDDDRHPRAGAAAARQARSALRRVPAAEPRSRSRTVADITGYCVAKGTEHVAAGGRLPGLRQRRRGLGDPRPRSGVGGARRTSPRCTRRSSPSRAGSRATVRRVRPRSSGAPTRCRARRAGPTWCSQTQPLPRPAVLLPGARPGHAAAADRRGVGRACCVAALAVGRRPAPEPAGSEGRRSRDVLGGQDRRRVSRSQVSSTCQGRAPRSASRAATSRRPGRRRPRARRLPQHPAHVVGGEQVLHRQVGAPRRAP